jgi:hypothetical protein
MQTPDVSASGPATLVDIGSAFYATRTLFSAVELNVFTVLADGPATADELRSRVGLHPRAARDFLDALAALGVLVREDGRYRNAPHVEDYLVRGRPGYLGETLSLVDTFMYPTWVGFTEALCVGGRPGGGDGDFTEELYRDQDVARMFLSGADVLNSEIGPALAERFDWSAYTTVVDAGGARGDVAAALVRARPHLRATVFDLPPVEPLFDEHVAELGVAGQVGFQAGDFFRDPLPEADVLILGHVLHDWSVRERHELLESAFKSVNPGGAVLIYDTMIDDERRDAMALLLSLKLLLISGRGTEYTPTDCRDWLEGAGFQVESIERLVGREVLAVGRKDG